MQVSLIVRRFLTIVAFIDIHWRKAPVYWVNEKLAAVRPVLDELNAQFARWLAGWLMG
jgi:hypothetical protein